jgi:four helix bundle protein
LYEETNKEPLRRDFALRNQIRRAGISIVLNIAEGAARKSDKEFAQFLFVALGSAAELKSAFYIAKDQEYFDEHSFRELYEQTDEVNRMLSGLIKYLRK